MKKTAFLLLTCVLLSGYAVQNAKTEKFATTTNHEEEKNALPYEKFKEDVDKLDVSEAIKDVLAFSLTMVYYSTGFDTGIIVSVTFNNNEMMEDTLASSEKKNNEYVYTWC